MGFKQLSFTLVTVLFVGVVLWLSPSPLLGQLPAPEDFFYTETKPLSPVPFSHKLHGKEKKLSCQDCHTKLFQMKKMTASPEMTMDTLNEGKFCGSCHNGTKAFTTNEIQSCLKCHLKK